MADAPDDPPVAAIPERLDRRLRLGPFASARDALRFVTYAAVGAVVAPVTGAGVWLAVLVAGFAVVVVRADGLAVDERAAAFLAWRWRALSGGRTRMTPGAFHALRQGYLTVAGRPVAIVRADGSPVAYLPPAELGRRVARFRELLRSLEGPLLFLVSAAPMSAARVRPVPCDPARRDGRARHGYAELVETLCRRRHVRRVFLALGAERPGAAGLSELELRVVALTDRLAGLGLSAVRLRGGPLLEAGRRWGWG